MPARSSKELREPASRQIAQTAIIPQIGWQETGLVDRITFAPLLRACGNVGKMAAEIPALIAANALHNIDVRTIGSVVGGGMMMGGV